MAKRSESAAFFNLRLGTRLGSANLKNVRLLLLQNAGVMEPRGFFHSSHSARIGGYNDLLGLSSIVIWIMNRFELVSMEILHVYCDSMITVTAASRLFFAHIMSQGQAA